MPEFCVLYTYKSIVTAHTMTNSYNLASDGMIYRAALQNLNIFDSKYKMFSPPRVVLR